MSQLRRVVVPGAPHHITQRGNARQNIFLSDTLRYVYLNQLREQASRNRLRILAYCLMTNHVHLVVVPESGAAMANTLRTAHSRFSQYWNTQFGRNGHLWQNRFYSCPIEDALVGRVLAYVENNPVRAGMVQSAADFAWSSARAHLNQPDPSGLLDLAWWRHCGYAEGWGEVLRNGPMPESELISLRRATVTGRPFGSRPFVDNLELHLGRPLAPRPAGRPKPSQPVEAAHAA